MPVIHLTTRIHAPRERVFDLARSIEFDQASTGDTGERAVAGVTTGLIGAGQEVTWEARHLGVRQRLRVKLTICERPDRFQDVMRQGAFSMMCHDHTLMEVNGETVMTDRFEFRSPLGPLGWLVDRVFLTVYLRRFLEMRNTLLKRAAESDEWKPYLATHHE